MSTLRFLLRFSVLKMSFILPATYDVKRAIYSLAIDDTDTTLAVVEVSTFTTKCECTISNPFLAV